MISIAKQPRNSNTLLPNGVRVYPLLICFRWPKKYVFSPPPLTVAFSRIVLIV